MLITLLMLETRSTAEWVRRSEKASFLKSCFRTLRFCRLKNSKQYSSHCDSSKTYWQRIKQLRLERLFSDLRYSQAQLARSTKWRAAIFCSVALSAQMTETAIQENQKTFLKNILWIFKRMDKHLNIVLNFAILEKKFLNLQVYSNTSLETSHSKSSQTEYIVYLLDVCQLCYLLHWNLY